MNWQAYVQQQRGQDNDTQLGAKVGLTASSVGRWERSAPKVESVHAFAIAYSRPVLEAFVAAGFLTSEQASATVIRQDIDALTDDDLAGELLARLKELRNATQIQEPQQGQGSASSSGRRAGAPKTRAVVDNDGRAPNVGPDGRPRNPAVFSALDQYDAEVAARNEGAAIGTESHPPV